MTTVTLSVPPRAKGQLDQAAAALFRRLVGERGADLVIGHMRGQPVAADQELVARVDAAVGDVERQLVHGADGARDHVAPRPGEASSWVSKPRSIKSCISV